MRLRPVTQAEAKKFVARHHRHNLPSIGSVCQIGLEDAGGGLIGVAVLGIPKARLLMDGRTLEVTRVCTLGDRNACSMLYGAAARAAAALGYVRIVTYTLESESGASLRGAGWRRDEALRTHDVAAWGKTNGKPVRDLFGNERLPTGPKVRWFKYLTPAATQAVAS